MAPAWTGLSAVPEAGRLVCAIGRASHLVCDHCRSRRVGASCQPVADTATSRTNCSRRVRLPACGGYVCAWAPHQSHTPNVDAFRDFSRDVPPHLCFGLPPGAGILSSRWKGACRRRILGCLVKCWSDVCHKHLDVASLDESSLGVTRRPHRNLALRAIWLLGEQLLGWCCGRHWG